MIFNSITNTQNFYIQIQLQIRILTLFSGLRRYDVILVRLRFWCWDCIEPISIHGVLPDAYLFNKYNYTRRQTRISTINGHKPRTADRELRIISLSNIISPIVHY